MIQTTDWVALMQQLGAEFAGRTAEHAPDRRGQDSGYLEGSGDARHLSHDVEINQAFIPDAVTNGVRRPVGKWHPFMHTAALVALPRIYAAYLGVAESARDRALRLASRKKNDALIPILVGEMENQLITAQLAHGSMAQLPATQKPGPEAC